MKKRSLCLLCALLLALLSGCSLAQGEGSLPVPDRLIGTFVTMDYLRSSAQTEGLPDGGDPMDPTIAFAGLSGVPVFCYPVEEEGQAVTYVGSEDPHVFEPSTGVHVGGGLTYEATLTILPETRLHFNRLYRRDDGSFYLKSEIGTGFGEGEGSVFFREEDAGPASSWDDGPWFGDFTFHVRTHKPIERYVLCHMSADNQELKRESYLPGQLPENLTMEGDWLLVEEYQTGKAGTEILRWTVEAGEEVLTTLMLEKSGLFCKMESTLSWIICEKNA